MHYINILYNYANSCSLFYVLSLSEFYNTLPRLAYSCIGYCLFFKIHNSYYKMLKMLSLLFRKDTIKTEALLFSDILSQPALLDVYKGSICVCTL